MNGTNNLSTECAVGQVLIERTETMGKRLDGHDTAINGLRNRLPNWAVFAISGLMGIIGWLLSAIRG